MKEADYRIVADGADITSMIRKRLIKLTVQDSAGEASDTVAIELDNRDNLIRLPPTGAGLQVWMGEADALVYKGFYEVDELEEPLDDQALVIHGKAAKMKSTIKAPRDASHDEVTLGALVAQIAERNGYQAAVAPALADHLFQHIDQRAESDMNLLTRLARELDAVAKPIGERLVVVPKGEAKTVSGQALQTVVIDDPQNSSGRVVIQDRNDYGQALANWFSEAEQRKVPVVVGLVDGAVAVLGDAAQLPSEGEAPSRYVIRKTYTDEKSAKEGAVAQLKKLLRGKSTMSLVRPLMPSIVAEGRLDVRNHRTSANQLWQIESVTHVIGSGEVASSTMECVIPAK